MSFFRHVFSCERFIWIRIMYVMLSSLGCDKNLVESEMMLGLMADAGYQLTDDEMQAEIIIVNTCSFIADAKQESIDTLIEYGELKKTGNLKVLVCAGCLGQRYTEDVKNELPEVDIIIGTTAFDKIDQAIKEFLSNNKAAAYIDDVQKKLVYGKRRILSTGGHYAHLKIAEGCDKHCTYCAIPIFRGNFRSVPMEAVLEEARTLADGGVKELILVAQEITVYGTDIYGEKRLHELLSELCKIEGIEWIRLLYCYPEEIYDELIATMKREPKICHYFDMPIQHADDYILQRMGRRTDKKYLEELIGKLRREIPDICLRTTLITGFPGETEKHFQSMVDFVRDMRFDRLGVFTYSEEEDTVAAGMPDQVDEDVKAKRRDIIMELQQEIAFEKASEKIGRKVRCMIEGRIEEGALVARSYMDAPDVDGYVFIDTDRDLESGRMVDVLITDSNEYDLIGELV